MRFTKNNFTLHGHRWKAQPDDLFTRIIPIQEAVSFGNVLNIEPEHTECSGDYMYRSGSLRWDVESGMWGIFRVMNRYKNKSTVESQLFWQNFNGASFY